MDKEHYHYLIDGCGNIIKGKFKPEDNLNCKDGNYAAHCGGKNTGNIGLAFCGCYIPNGKTIQQSNFPLTRVQLEAGFKLCAKLAKKYNIPIDSFHIFTHYEFGVKNPKTSSAGKIDITYLHPHPDITPKECGDYIRNKVKWYYGKL